MAAVPTRVAVPTIVADLIVVFVVIVVVVVVFVVGINCLKPISRSDTALITGMPQDHNTTFRCSHPLAQSSRLRCRFFGLVKLVQKGEKKEETAKN